MSNEVACVDSETDSSPIISWEECRNLNDLRLYLRQRLGPETDLPKELTVIDRADFVSKLLRNGDGIFARVYNHYPEMLDHMLMLYNRTQVAISFSIETPDVGQVFLEYLQEHESDVGAPFLRDLTRSIQWCRAMHHKWRQRVAANGVEYFRVGVTPRKDATWEEAEE